MNSPLNLITSSILAIARLVERIATYTQGKGYGKASIKQENRLVHKLLQKRPELVLDIGGNIGAYTAEIRRLNPNAEIHTFEPSTTNTDKLTLRFANDKKIKLLPYAVSDKTGSATLFADKPGSGLGSLTQRKLDHFNIDFNSKETVNTIRLEDYWEKSLNKRNIDILKLDIEGHEFEALIGLGEAIFTTSAIQFEFGGCNIDTRTYFQDF